MRLMSPFIALACAASLIQPAIAEEKKPVPKTQLEGTTKDLEDKDTLQNYEVQDLTSKKSKGKPQTQDLTIPKTIDKSSPN